MNAETTTMKKILTNFAPAGDRRSGAEVAADEVGEAHDETDPPQHLALRHEDHQRGEVGGPVGQAGLGGRLEEVVAEEADQDEDEERTRARAECAVVEPDGETGQHRSQRVPMAGESELGLLAEFGLEQDIGADHDEHDQDDRVEGRARDLRGDQGSRDGADEGKGHQRQERPGVGLDPPVVRRRAHRRTAHARQLVGRQHLDRGRTGEPHQQGRELDQPPTPDDGVDVAGCQRREPQQQDDLESGDRPRRVSRQESLAHDLILGSSRAHRVAPALDHRDSLRHRRG